MLQMLLLPEITPAAAVAAEGWVFKGAEDQQRLKDIEFTETKPSQGGVVYSSKGSTSGTISPMGLGDQLNAAKNDSKAMVIEITNQYKDKKP